MSRPLPNPTALLHQKDATAALKRAEVCTEQRDRAGHAHWIAKAQGHCDAAAACDPSAKRYTGFASRRPRRDA